MKLTPYLERIAHFDGPQPIGIVTRAIGLMVEARGLRARIGDFCQIETADHGETILVEVVGFRDDALLLMPFSELHGVRPGSRVARAKLRRAVPTGPSLLGRVIDALGHPIDEKGPLDSQTLQDQRSAPPTALERPPITEPFITGIRVIDGMLTCGIGQRMGIFAGSGVGKSTLLGMIARGGNADVAVIGLVGERGREVQDFIEKNLGPDGMQRAVVVVATSDQPALMRLKAAWMSTAIAESFRDSGCRVLLMVDSLTRVAMAQREIGLATGEPPALRGYTPSVFALLPRLLERSGNARQGSITAFYTVLVEGDDMNEPITDTVRGVLDGHIVLSRQLAAENHFPAIDVLHSISRTMGDVVTPDHLASAARLRDVLATYEKHHDLITIGAYVPGSSPQIDHALSLYPQVQGFFRQSYLDFEPFDRTAGRLHQLAQQ